MYAYIYIYTHTHIDCIVYMPVRVLPSLLRSAEPRLLRSGESQASGSWPSRPFHVARIGMCIYIYIYIYMYTYISLSLSMHIYIYI